MTIRQGRSSHCSYLRTDRYSWYTWLQMWFFSSRKRGGIAIPDPRAQEPKMSPRVLELENHNWSQGYQESLSVRT